MKINMKKLRAFLIGLAVLLLFNITLNAQSRNAKLIFIRHAEKSADGDNLTCQGFNRSMLLSTLLYNRFGKPDNIYVPSVKPGSVTKHARMLQTISPLVIKYNLTLNSEFDSDDYEGIGKALLNENGTVFIIWDHQGIPPILEYLGISSNALGWPENDFDSIWIVTFSNRKAILVKGKEGLNPASGCRF
jgi:hypothetical protein